ncbi:hypothetical protein FRC09_005967 [Ceratobasidium sp. 395]|nr:hypothetical protein FRC09_005967 [Ceratobasidium sp. 395]
MRTPPIQARDEGRIVAAHQFSKPIACHPLEEILCIRMNLDEETEPILESEDQEKGDGQPLDGRRRPTFQPYPRDVNIQDSSNPLEQRFSVSILVYGDSEDSVACLSGGHEWYVGREVEAEDEEDYEKETEDHESEPEVHVVAGGFDIRYVSVFGSIPVALNSGSERVEERGQSSQSSRGWTMKKRRWAMGRRATLSPRYMAERRETTYWKAIGRSSVGAICWMVAYRSRPNKHPTQNDDLGSGPPSPTAKVSSLPTRISVLSTLDTHPLDLDLCPLDSNHLIWEPVADGSDLESKQRPEWSMVNVMVYRDVEGGNDEDLDTNCGVQTMLDIPDITPTRTAQRALSITTLSVGAKLHIRSSFLAGFLPKSRKTRALSDTAPGDYLPEKPQNSYTTPHPLELRLPFAVPPVLEARAIYSPIEPRAKAEPQSRMFIAEAIATFRPIRPEIASEHRTSDYNGPARLIRIVALGSRLESYLVNGILQWIWWGLGCQSRRDGCSDITSYSDHNFHSNVGERQNPDWSLTLETELELTVAAVVCTMILQAMANLYIHTSLLSSLLLAARGVRAPGNTAPDDPLHKKPQDRDIITPSSTYPPEIQSPIAAPPVLFHPVRPEAGFKHRNHFDAHATLVSQRHATTFFAVGATLSRVADASWTGAREHIRRAGLDIGRIGQWRSLCEGGWAAAVPEDLPDIDKPGSGVIEKDKMRSGSPRKGFHYNPSLSSNSIASTSIASTNVTGTTSTSDSQSIPLMSPFPLTPIPGLGANRMGGYFNQDMSDLKPPLAPFARNPGSPLPSPSLDPTSPRLASPAPIMSPPITQQTDKIQFPPPPQHPASPTRPHVGLPTGDHDGLPPSTPIRPFATLPGSYEPPSTPIRAPASLVRAPASPVRALPSPVRTPAPIARPVEAAPTPPTPSTKPNPADEQATPTPMRKPVENGEWNSGSWGPANGEQED